MSYSLVCRRLNHSGRVHLGEDRGLRALVVAVLVVAVLVALPV